MKVYIFNTLFYDSIKSETKFYIKTKMSINQLFNEHGNFHRILSVLKHDRFSRKEHYIKIFNTILECKKVFIPIND